MNNDRELMVCKDARLGFFSKSEPIMFGLHLDLRSGSSHTGAVWNARSENMEASEAEQIMWQASAVCAEDLIGKMFWVEWPAGKFRGDHGTVTLAEEFLFLAEGKS